MNSLKQKINNLSSQVDYLKGNDIYLFYRELNSAQDVEMVEHGRKILMFGSNSYLGLTNHPRVKAAAIKAIEKYGTGVSGSRLLNGNLDIHRELEERLAVYLGKEDVAVFSTGFQANLGAIPPIMDRSGCLLMDKLSHASIIESAVLSHAKKLKFEHNNVQSLDRLLKNCPAESLKLVVTEGIFSMDGDISNLPDIVKTAENYNAMVMVDDAHAIGVLGKNGSGTSSHFGLTDRVHIITGTFSKSLAALGGFIAADKDIINLIKHTSRALMFSAGLQPASVAAVMTALDIIEEEPELIEKLWENTHYSIQQMKQMGFDIGNAETPIIPIYIRDDYKTYCIAKKLYDDGVFINPVVSPATSADSALIRFSVMSSHTKAQIDFALSRIYENAKALQII
ncbi:MAG: pyridoxal phosphate-dependent aminotransferase family protein [Saprospiraceae bacterium]|nr:pyridoxal phosphate-dependent aminotransferase family protein [Saprospiraceae bacterium]MBK8450351.1 pyridoxal phosphate-dependent aminotransferase family protein [Saprospiraceae bacterium]MBK9222798.1 pyridoxal phosphate-dependent aminotransferase family protein [Saprospiraceae bacterium]MBK9720162.1 pyridoxal phosphate-dependent aminotransferase family protein [Saprospiraceae bacterium]MBK9727155.1 pyridoxal phosphate-dependent aminotransferase family protein [Saprospiraceae bacterium]